MTQPIAVRLPEDLDIAIRQRAHELGVSTSDMLRSIVAQWAYGEPVTIEDGFLSGRRTALQLAMELLPKLFEKSFPKTLAEAQQKKR